MTEPITADELLQISARAKFLAESYKHHRDGTGLAVKELSRDSVPRLIAECERLRGDEATMKLSRMLGLGDPVRPDIHAVVVRERDALHAEVADLRDERGALWRRRDQLFAECERMRPVYEAAIAVGGDIHSVRGYWIARLRDAVDAALASETKEPR